MLPVHPTINLFFVNSEKKKNVNCLYSALACDSVHCVSYMQFALILYTFESYSYFAAHSAVMCS